ncbi:DUF637 domain-containing protein [Brenneria rubrifaciens]|uniref:Filamentous hemagglutinin N-terminal domain-containing protein n=1 Tax=Brenneria rubrifaciens TaxID=55213 RepID=A0A4P8QSN8_9GAMM|nr:DUF637 domain-containing protein [Brenneria rubrifaciens]QCR10098.1 filamentous hemagglutinin N-terminal domain-containing protein [Brenneria rubrifaciens]
METLNRRATRGLGYLLIYLTAIQPLHPAFAAGITAASGNTQVLPGEVPVVNIATPNAAGISHNTYQDFNVGTPGAVLNNSTVAGKSPLAGQLEANPALKGHPADLIINEVTGTARSQLQGKLEVFGNKANVLIANPNGITCDGCGFINTPGVTLTTGKPQLDKQGALDALAVRQGSVVIGPGGLDAGTQDYVDIISRAAELNGKINAANLSLTLGANRVNVADGSVTPIAGQGDTPPLAVDTKALGGMYADKIRLVATEEGVGVNLGNLTSTRQGITLSANGQLRLGDASAKSDLNLNAQQTDIDPGAKVVAERDITLSAATLNNHGTLSAGRDMRLFSDQLTNTQATIAAENNLWLQKDAQGNKGQRVENRSGTIKTHRGDLVIRTGRLDNVFHQTTDEKTEVSAPQGLALGHMLGWKWLPDEKRYVRVYGALDFDEHKNQNWFNMITFAALNDVNFKKYRYNTVLTGDRPEINAGANLYIHATELNNIVGDMSADRNLLLTGERLNIEGRASGFIKFYKTYENRPLPFVDPTMEEYFLKDWTKTETYFFNSIGDAVVWDVKDRERSKISAKGNLVADFKETINLVTPTPAEQDNADEVIDPLLRFNTLSARNITLAAKHITSTEKLGARDDITLIARENIDLKDSELNAGNTVSLLAAGHVNGWQSSIQAENLNVTARTGDVTFRTSLSPRFYSAYDIYSTRDEQKSALTVSGDMSLSAGNDLSLSDIVFTPGRNISLTAGNDLLVENTVALSSSRRVGTALSNEPLQKTWGQTLVPTGRLKADESVLLNANGTLTLRGARIDAGRDITLSAARHIDLSPNPLPDALASHFPSSRTPELRSTLNAGNHLSLFSGADINAQALSASAGKDVTVSAGRRLLMPASAYDALAAENGDKDQRHVAAALQAGNKLTVTAQDTLRADGARFSSGNDMTFSANGDMAFNAVANRLYQAGDKEHTESITQQNTQLSSGGVLTLLSGGSILFQATQLLAKGALDAAATGGFLYAQAMEESNRYERIEQDRKWYGKKVTVRRIRHDVTNKVTAFTAGDDINLLSRDDSTYEASKINAGNNATLTSTHGKVNFRAVKNTAFEQTITTAKGFFIKNADKGYAKDTWLLPAVYTGGNLTVDAATGITADVKTQNARSLQQALLTLGDTPGTAWLKGLNTREDVQWNAVQDAYSNWDYKSQSLNPAVGAVIAIAVAAVTAGSGLAAAAGDFAVGAAGAGAAPATYGAAYSGMTALTAQAAVALVENEGNLSKTLQAMGRSGSVKSLVTSMVIGGALAGFDDIMTFNQTAGGVAPEKARLPLLRVGDWGKIARRVAGQSVIQSSLNTGINGGSFKDNFTDALLANIGGQINAEGASLIGDNGQVLGVPGKMLSHAVVSGVAAEIGRGNAKGAAAGALAAELAGIIINDNLVKTENWQEQQAQISRVAGAFAGALATGKASGVDSGANAAEMVERFNRQLHLDELKAIKELADGDKAKEERLLAASCRQVNCTSQESLNSAERQRYEALMEKYPATREEDGLLANYWVQKARQRTGNYPLYAGYDVAQLFTYTQADKIADSQLFSRNQWIENAADITGWSRETIETLGYTESVIVSLATLGKSGKFASLGTPAAGKYPYQASDYLRDIQKYHTDELIKLFDRNQNQSTLTLYGQTFTQATGKGGSNRTGTTKVFNSENLSDQEIRNYAQSLTGGAAFKETLPGRVWTAQLADGSKINLRSVSSSSDKTKARWTVEILQDSNVSKVVGENVKRIEIKFR